MHIVDINNIEDLNNFDNLPFTSLIELKHPHHHKNHHHKNHHHNYHPQSYHSSIYPDIYSKLSNCTHINNCFNIPHCLACSDITSFFLLIFMFSLICSLCCKSRKKTIKKKIITVEEPDIKVFEEEKKDIV